VSNAKTVDRDRILNRGSSRASYSSNNAEAVGGASSVLLVNWQISLDMCNDAEAVGRASSVLLVNNGLLNGLLSLGVDDDGGERIHL